MLVSAFCKDPGGAGSIPRHFVFAASSENEKKMKRGRPIAERGCAPVCRNRRNGRNGRCLGFAGIWSLHGDRLDRLLHGSPSMHNWLQPTIIIMKNSLFFCGWINNSLLISTNGLCDPYINYWYITLTQMWTIFSTPHHGRTCTRLAASWRWDRQLRPLSVALGSQCGLVYREAIQIWGLLDQGWRVFWHGCSGLGIGAEGRQPLQGLGLEASGDG